MGLRLPFCHRDARCLTGSMTRYPLDMSTASQKKEKTYLASRKVRQRPVIPAPLMNWRCEVRLLVGGKNPPPNALKRVVELPWAPASKEFSVEPRQAFQARQNASATPEEPSYLRFAAGRKCSELSAVQWPAGRGRQGVVPEPLFGGVQTAG